MKYLGIDFGTKKIGCAVSDESGSIAFPGTSFPYTPDTVAVVRDMVESEKIEAIVIGDTLSGDGEKNDVTTALETFIADLKIIVSVPIHLEREFFTSEFAKQYDNYQKPIATPHRSGTKPEKNDSSAAALILQRYLDKQSHKNI